MAIVLLIGMLTTANLLGVKRVESSLGRLMNLAISTRLLLFHIYDLYSPHVLHLRKLFNLYILFNFRSLFEGMPNRKLLFQTINRS